MFLFGKFSNYIYILFSYYVFIGYKYLLSFGLVVSSKYDEIVKVLWYLILYN